MKKSSGKDSGQKKVNKKSISLKLINKKNMSKHFGALRLSIDPMKFQKEIRQEWLD